MASLGVHSGGPAKKIVKAKGIVVKPILKKLSHSEKNSLDLDRGWDEQQVEQLEVDGWDEGLGYAGQARDVSAGVAAAGFGAGDGASAGAGGGSGIRAGNLKFQHGRSASQTSAGSGPRGGAFVHPFAQTPRTSTPPLSYANSLASFDNGRDCSPTITENEDDDGFDINATTYPHPHMLAHELTASKPPSLRINTGRSISGTTATSSRFAHGSLPSASHSDLLLDSHNLSVSLTGTLDSPTGSLGAGSVIVSQQQYQQEKQQSQMSPLRTSLEMAAAGFPRLRSRSEVDTATRVENIRAARRKFEERERVKEEKYDREMIRKRERRDTKMAARIEKGELPTSRTSNRKKTNTGLSTVSEPGARPSKGGILGVHSPPSASSVGVGIVGRRHTDSPTANVTKAEKQMGFAARRYESVSLETPPAFGVTVDDVHFEHTRPRRGSGAKRKTQGYWQGFLLWLRTKLLRLSAR
ncbi:hypothetical protein N657DRAFT_630502 [Parathielavia appendiculata]|uniref:Uncharacterized protein n=1 Tax=Parathielavia appendiculata TaxID=2587402 RepID=A0AAN6UBG4_9PEZI|nr:hypothetical protein N657DRAFT_630502 [Parathielavia appendiculata]